MYTAWHHSPKYKCINGRKRQSFHQIGVHSTGCFLWTISASFNIVRRCLITKTRLDSATTWCRSTKSPDTYCPQVAQESGKAHCEMILNNKTQRMLLLEHSQPTFRLIEGSEGRGEWTAWWSLKREIWIITPRRGRMITKWDNGTPMITNDDKTRYNQWKSTLFHFLTEFKHIEPFWGSWSFRPFWPLATILGVLVSWPQIRGRSLVFYSAPSCLTAPPTEWLL